MDAMAEDRLAQLVRSSADELWVSFQRSSSTAHAGMKGTAREAAVQKFLADRLPATVRVTGGGEVIDSHGTSAGQSDVLLIDPVTPPFVNDSHHQVVPVECVQGLVEVKSNLTSRELIDACEKIARVKALSRVALIPIWPASVFPAGPPQRTTAGWVFAFDSDVKLRTLLTRYARWCGDAPPGHWPNAVFILNKGSLIWIDGMGHLSATPQPGGQIMALASGNSVQRDVLLTMIWHMYGVLASPPTGRLDIGAYLPTATIGFNDGIETPMSTMKP